MFQRVIIVGVGLLGTSLGLAMKARGLANHITGVGRLGSTSLNTALQRLAIDSASTNLPDALQKSPDLIILCTPLRQFPDAFKALHGRLSPNTLITDVGSTKTQVMAWAQEYLAIDPAIFIGSHPMAGSEKRGPESARPDLYDGGLCLLCEPTPPNPNALAKIEALWRAVGMRTLRLTPALHDQWVATISHLPHAVAFALVNTASKHPEMLQAAAGGFLDTTRIASSDVDMWTDIFLTNRAAVAASIDAFSADLASLKHAIMTSNESAIRTALTHGKAARDALIASRQTSK